ncbi:hypothetical protein LMG26857_03669 [Achromobacter anxifer]|uniref:hypothetical protein n=1 Tax=Achromobacter anxifer TaxID=1287737 RepID=UPI00155CB2EB|nr:hypothetical protein [Achromobacter anxifer]CAB5514610.1 hypothetical protein LMG26857_03669 [Achromobacter anxifer]
MNRLNRIGVRSRAVTYAGLVAVALSLTGCAGTAVMHLAAVSADTAFSTKLYPDQGQVKIPTELESVTPMTYTREFWRADGAGKCVYAGVIVPWDRTWPLEITNEGNTTVLPPEPGVRAGYVTLVNEKRCSTAPAQKVLLIGEQRTARALLGAGFDGKPLVDKGMTTSTADVIEMKAESRPQWFPQVIQRLTRLAPANRNAKAFLEKSQDDLIKLLPDQADAIRSAVR